MTDLSIIIVNLNNSKILKECLDSVYKTTKKYKFEIMVVDNGSIDGSQSMIKELFPQVKLIENNKNLGFAKANNQGLKIANGRYSLLLNNDTIVKEGAFDRMIEFMDNNLKAGACGPKLLNIDGTIQHQGSILGKRFWISALPVEVDFVVGACLMVKKEVIEKVGLMDENLFFYNDDLDWCMSIRKAGYKVYYLPQAEVIHYGGYSNKGAFNRRIFVEGFKGGLYFVRKHYGVAPYYLYKVLLFAGIIIYLPFFIISFPFKREQFKNRLLAYLDILRVL
ncbi:MAG: glycosyltransferase family 2 protein [Candidatus Margulisiibacteriota bacterium]